MMLVRSPSHHWGRVGLVLTVATALLLTLAAVSPATDGGSGGSDDPTVRLLIITNAGPDIMDQAWGGSTDLVMVHLGHAPLHEFVRAGRGYWPATVSSNSVVLLAPPDDPAGIADAADPWEAFERIAEEEAPFVVNNLGETRYITDTLWHAAAGPDPGD